MVVCIWANFQTLYVSIHTTYSTDVIEITDMVFQIRQCKLKSSLFQVNMQLRIEYSRITNQQFKWFTEMPDAYSSLCI